MDFQDQILCELLTVALSFFIFFYPTLHKIIVNKQINKQKQTAKVIKLLCMNANCQEYPPAPT